MLYYEDTKLRNRRRSREGYVYIYSAKIPLTRAPVSVTYNSAIISYRGGAPAPSQGYYIELGFRVIFRY